MIFKIDKKQTGGSFARLSSPFTSTSLYQPPAPSTAGYSGSGGYGSSKEDNEETILSKDIYKELLTKGGLTNDVQQFIDEIVSAQYSPFSIIDPNNSAQAIRQIAKVVEIQNNKALWDDALTTAKTNQSYAETAMSSIGELFYKNEAGEIETISLGQYKKNPEKYKRLLSVADLLLERQRNPNLAFNTRVFNIVKESVATQSVLDKVKSLYESIGEYTQNTDRHYTKEEIKKLYESEKDLLTKAGRKPTAQELKSFKILSEALETPGEFLQINIKEKEKAKDLNSAFNYIFGALTNEEKAKLELMGAPNKQGYKEVLAGMLDGLTGGEFEYTISPVKESAISDKVSKADQKALTPLQLMHTDKLATPGMTFAYNDPKMSTMFRGLVTGVGPVIDIKGNSVGYSTVGEILRGHNLGTFLESDKVYFGDKRVGPELSNFVIYDAQDAAKIYMPVDEATGKPDYDSLKEFKDIYAVYEANKDKWTAAQATKYFRDNHFNITIDEEVQDGQKVKVIRDNRYVKPFYVFYGYTNDATGLTEDNEQVYKISDEEKDVMEPILKSLWTVGTGKNVRNLTPDKKWHTEKYYKGLVAIPYRPGANAIINALSNQGPLLAQPTYEDVARNLRLSSNQPQYGDPSGAQLYK